MEKIDLQVNLSTIAKLKQLLEQSSAAEEQIKKRTLETNDARRAALQELLKIRQQLLQQKDLLNPEAVKKAYIDIDKLRNALGGVIKAVLSVNNLIKAAFALKAIEIFGERIDNISKALTQTLGKFEKFGAVLETALGSKSAAQLALDRIQDFASKTPFSVEQLTQSFVKFANSGIEPTNAAMTALGDFASATGKEMDQLTEAILDVSNSERWKEFGVKASLAGDKVRLTFKGLTKEVENTREGVFKAVQEFGKMQGVAGGMAKISQTLEGQLSNLGDSWQQTVKNFAEGLRPTITRIIGFFNTVLSSVDFTKVGAAINSVLQSILNAGAAILPVFRNVYNLISSVISAATEKGSVLNTLATGLSSAFSVLLNVINAAVNGLAQVLDFIGVIDLKANEINARYANLLKQNEETAKKYVQNVVSTYQQEPKAVKQTLETLEKERRQYVLKLIDQERAFETFMKNRKGAMTKYEVEETKKNFETQIASLKLGAQARQDAIDEINRLELKRQKEANNQKIAEDKEAAKRRAEEFKKNTLKLQEENIRLLEEIANKEKEIQIENNRQFLETRLESVKLQQELEADRIKQAANARILEVKKTIADEKEKARQIALINQKLQLDLFALTQKGQADIAAAQIEIQRAQSTRLLSELEAQKELELMSILDYEDKKFEITLQSLETEKKILQAAGQETIEIDKQIQDTILKNRVVLRSRELSLRKAEIDEQLKGDFEQRRQGLSEQFSLESEAIKNRYTQAGELTREGQLKLLELERQYFNGIAQIEKEKLDLIKNPFAASERIKQLKLIYQAEYAAAAENVDKQKQLYAQLTRAILNELSKTAETYGELARDTLNGIGQLIDAQAERRQAELDASIESSRTTIELNEQRINRIRDLEERASGEEQQRLIQERQQLEARNQFEMNEQKRLEEEKKREEVRSAKRRQVIAIAQALIDGALAQLKIAATYPFPTNLPFAAVAAFQTLAQIAIIKAQKFAKGGVNIQGAGTETSDSIPAMLSRGESVITAEKTKQFLPTLIAIHKGEVDPIRLNNFVSENLDSTPKTVVVQDNSKVVSLLEEIRDKPEQVVELSNKGLRKYIRTATEEIEYLNNRYS